MNFPTILTVVSLAGGGLVYATQASKESGDELSQAKKPLIRETGLQQPGTLVSQPVEERGAASMASTVDEKKSEVDQLKARIAELEKENTKFKTGDDLRAHLEKALTEQLKDGAFFNEGAQTQALQKAFSHFGQDPAAILGLESKEDKERFQAVLAEFQAKYRDIAKLHETVETENENMTIKVIESFPEEGAVLREDLAAELRMFNSDDEKVEKALDALAPRYGGFGAHESRSMSIKNTGMGTKSGSAAKIEMVMMGDVTKAEPSDK